MQTLLYVEWVLEDVRADWAKQVFLQLVEQIQIYDLVAVCLVR